MTPNIPLYFEIIPIEEIYARHDARKAPLASSTPKPTPAPKPPRPPKPATPPLRPAAIAPKVAHAPMSPWQRRVADRLAKNLCAYCTTGKPAHGARCQECWDKKMLREGRAA